MSYDWTAARDRLLGQVEGLSLAVASEALGVSQGTIKRWRDQRSAGEGIGPEPRGAPRRALLRAMEDRPEAPAQNADAVSLNGEPDFYRRYDEIMRSDLDSWHKTWHIAEMAAAIRASALRTVADVLREAERAAVVRAEAALAYSRAAEAEARAAENRGAPRR